MSSAPDATNTTRPQAPPSKELPGGTHAKSAPTATLEPASTSAHPSPSSKPSPHVGRPSIPDNSFAATADSRDALVLGVAIGLAVLGVLLVTCLVLLLVRMCRGGPGQRQAHSRQGHKHLFSDRVDLDGDRSDLFSPTQHARTEAIRAGGGDAVNFRAVGNTSYDGGHSYPLVGHLSVPQPSHRREHRMELDTDDDGHLPAQATSSTYFLSDSGPAQSDGGDVGQQAELLGPLGHPPPRPWAVYPYVDPNCATVHGPSSLSSTQSNPHVATSGFLEPTAYATRAHLPALSGWQVDGAASNYSESHAQTDLGGDARRNELQQRHSITVSKSSESETACSPTNAGAGGEWASPAGLEKIVYKAGHGPMLHIDTSHRKSSKRRTIGDGGGRASPVSPLSPSPSLIGGPAGGGVRGPSRLTSPLSTTAITHWRWPDTPSSPASPTTSPVSGPSPFSPFFHPYAYAAHPSVHAYPCRPASSLGFVPTYYPVGGGPGQLGGGGWTDNMYPSYPPPPSTTLAPASEHEEHIRSRDHTRPLSWDGIGCAYCHGHAYACAPAYGHGDGRGPGDAGSWAGAGAHGGSVWNAKHVAHAPMTDSGEHGINDEPTGPIRVEDT